MNRQGLLLCTKYSVAPNYFGYCGPDENMSLIDHLRENVIDKEVHSILSEFETLFLNLTFIARENKIQDVFDKQVVEAYWIGNRLLECISNKDYAYLLAEKFSLPKKIGDKTFLKMKHKILTYRLYPHHSFHVFNIFKRTGHDISSHTIKTMDECRIGWGKVITINDSTVLVFTKPLQLQNRKLQFGKELRKKIRLEYKGKKFLKHIKAEDWVSFHWGQICDVIQTEQVKQLNFYTQKAIEFYNSP